MRFDPSPRVFARCLVLVLLLAASAAAAEAPDWASVAAEGTVEIVTTNEDGSPKETTIWLAVVDGQGYIRTGNTRWAANIERNRDVALRIQDKEYPLRVEFVEDDALRMRIESTFREKYGFSDAFIAVFRGGRPKIMRLLAR